MNFNTEVFNVLRGFNKTITMFNQSGKQITNSEAAYSYYIEPDKSMLTITGDGPDRTLTLHLSGLVDIKDKNTAALITALRSATRRYGWLWSMERHKSSIHPREFSHLFTDETVKEGTGRLYGHMKTSYENVGDCRIVIRHTGPVTRRHSKIGKMFIEHSGKRFSIEGKNLLGARALARHVSDGGSTVDETGLRISRLSRQMEEMSILRREAKRQKLEENDARLFGVIDGEWHQINQVLSAIYRDGCTPDAISALNNIEPFDTNADADFLVSRFPESPPSALLRIAVRMKTFEDAAQGKTLIDYVSQWAEENHASNLASETAKIKLAVFIKELLTGKYRHQPTLSGSYASKRDEYVHRLLAHTDSLSNEAALFVEKIAQKIQDGKKPTRNEIRIADALSELTKDGDQIVREYAERPSNTARGGQASGILAAIDDYVATRSEEMGMSESKLKTIMLRIVGNKMPQAKLVGRYSNEHDETLGKLSAYLDLRIDAETARFINYLIDNYDNLDRVERLAAKSLVNAVEHTVPTIEEETVNRFFESFMNQSVRRLMEGVQDVTDGSVVVMDRTFKTKVAPDDDSANAYMAANDGWGVIEVNDGGVHMARMDDKGTPVKESADPFNDDIDDEDDFEVIHSVKESSTIFGRSKPSTSSRPTDLQEDDSVDPVDDLLKDLSAVGDDLVDAMDDIKADSINESVLLRKRAGLL